MGQEHLAERVIDLVRASVEQIFALDVNPGATERIGQSTCVI
jgi:hypothetical protein